MTFNIIMTCLLIALVGVVAYVAYDAWSEWRFQRSFARYRTRQAAARVAFFAYTETKPLCEDMPVRFPKK